MCSRVARRDDAVLVPNIIRVDFVLFVYPLYRDTYPLTEACLRLKLKMAPGRGLLWW